jgi:hypothetical protein
MRQRRRTPITKQNACFFFAVLWSETFQVILIAHVAGGSGSAGQLPLPGRQQHPPLLVLLVGRLDRKNFFLYTSQTSPQRPPASRGMAIGGLAVTTNKWGSSTEGVWQFNYFKSVSILSNVLASSQVQTSRPSPRSFQTVCSVMFTS